MPCWIHVDIMHVHLDMMMCFASTFCIVLVSYGYRTFILLVCAYIAEDVVMRSFNATGIHEES